MRSPRDLMHKAKKLQTSRVARHRLIQSLVPEDVIRIYSASDEGAAIIQVRPTSPNSCFQSLDFKVLLYLCLVIRIAAADVNCSVCACIGSAIQPSSFSQRLPSQKLKIQAKFLTPVECVFRHFSDGEKQFLIIKLLYYEREFLFLATIFVTNDKSCLSIVLQ